MSGLVKALIVWRFSDGKPGHDTQSRGLTDALTALTNCHIEHIPAPPSSTVITGLLSHRFNPGVGLPDPHLLIGAGHKTHLPLLSARNARGGKVVVLMKPSLPISWFNLCLIPEHDNAPDRANIIRTRGPLNTVRKSPDKIRGKGMILVGGPSRHHGWNTDLLIIQIQKIISVGPVHHWILADSPRTPELARISLKNIAADNLEYHPFSETPRDWLAGKIASASTVWVTEDSASMVYESLTAGTAVGLLEVPIKNTSRLTTAIRKLAEDGLTTTFSAWQTGKTLSPPPIHLNESARCAQLLLEYFEIPVSRS